MLIPRNSPCSILLHFTGLIPKNKNFSVKNMSKILENYHFLCKKVFCIQLTRHTIRKVASCQLRIELLERLDSSESLTVNRYNLQVLLEPRPIWQIFLPPQLRHIIPRKKMKINAMFVCIELCCKLITIVVCKVRENCY